MKTRLTDLSNCGIPAFTFAGFTFPKYVWTLPKGDFKKRIERHVNACTGDYYHAPKPNNTVDRSIGFYLDSDGMPDLRWKWCDEVDGCRVDHTGWYSDEYGDSEKIRGIVLRLPNNRGFLAGWSMGEGMASTVEYSIYDDEVDAAYAADSIAESTAESERDYQESERERIEAEEEKQESEEAQYWENRDCVTH